MAFTERLQTGAEIVFKETVYDGIHYICPTWDQMGRLNFDLGRKIIDSNNSDPPFDRLVALARGGWTWARDFADTLKIPELSTLRIKSYTGVNAHKEPEIVQPLTDPVNGLKILLFDEVVDYGKTIKKAIEYLNVMGAKEIKTVALCSKPHAETKPDFHIFSTDAWVVFPHEIREFVDTSAENWLEKGLTVNEITNRFTTIGISDYQTEYYLGLFLEELKKRQIKT